MEKEIEIKNKKNDSYKLIIKLELNEEDEKLLKKKDLTYLCYLQN